MNEKMKLEKLLEIAESNGIGADEFRGKVQDIYRDHCRENKNWHISSLREFTGIEPQIPEDIVLETMTNCGWDDHYNWSHWTKLTGVLPTEDQIQRKYHTYINNIVANYRLQLSAEHIEELVALTGVVPILPEQLVQQAYETSVRKMCLNEVAMVESTTGITPKIADAVAQEAFRRILVNPLSWYKNGFKELQKISQATPSEETVQSAYSHHIGDTPRVFDQNRVKGFREVFELTNIAPNDDIMQDMYAMCLKARWFDDVQYFIEATQIQPSAEVVDEALSHHCNYRNINSIHKVEELTGVQLPEYVIQDAYIKFFEQRDWEWIEDLKEATGVKFALADENVQAEYLRLVHDKHYTGIDLLENVTEIEPSTEVYNAFIADIMQIGS
jgi:hypothetical protein